MKLVARWGKSPRQIQAEFTAEELFDLQVFDERIEPFGDEWRQTGRIVAAIKNVLGGNATERDFMPLPPKRQTREEMAAILVRRLVG